VRAATRRRAIKSGCPERNENRLKKTEGGPWGTGFCSREIGGVSTGKCGMGDRLAGFANNRRPGGKDQD